MWITGGWGEHHSEMPEMRPVSLLLPSYSSSVFANFQPVQTSCDFWVRKLTRCWQDILLLLINPFTPKILVSFFSSPLTIPVSLNFSSNSRVLNQTVFAGGCSIPHHCWSFLRVKGLNDHSVFSFSSVFEILFHEAHAGSLQLIINTSGHPIVNIWRFLGQYLPHLGSIDLFEKGARRRKKKRANKWPPPSLSLFASKITGRSNNTSKP